VNIKATIETVASAAGFVALGLGLIYLASFGAILFAFFTMAPPPPVIF